MIAGAKESCVIMEDISPVLIDITQVSRHTVFVWPAKHGRHIGILSLSALRLSAGSHLVFRSINFEWIDQFQSKFTEG